MQIYPIRNHSCNVIYLYPPGQSICNSIFFTLNVRDLKVKLIDRVQPSRLPGIQIRLVKYVPQPTVITHQYKPPTKNIFPRRLQHMNDHSQLKIMCQIVILMLIPFSGPIIQYLSFLNDNSTNSSLEIIGTYYKLLVCIHNLQHQFMCQQLLKLLKTSFTFLCPLKIITFPLQLCDRICNA